MINFQITLKTEICKSCQLATWHSSSRGDALQSEICTSQVDGRPCATGFTGKWVKKCPNQSSGSAAREPRQSVINFIRCSNCVTVFETCQKKSHHCQLRLFLKNLFRLFFTRFLKEILIFERFSNAMVLCTFK